MPWGRILWDEAVPHGKLSGHVDMAVPILE